MGEREELLAAVRARLEQIAAAGDFKPVLEPDVLAETRRLAEFAGHGGGDLEAAHMGGWLHWARYQGVADERDLNAAIGAFTWCFIAGVDDVPDKLLPILAKQAVPAAKARLGELLQGRADQDLTGATASLWQRIVNAIPADDPEGPSYLSNFGLALVAWFGHTRRLADLDAAVDAARAAVAVSPADFPDRGVLLSNLGYALQARFGQTGEPADLDAAIDSFEGAVGSAPVDDSNRVAYLANLAGALQTRYLRTAAPRDLDAAIDAARTALDTASVDHSTRPSILNNQGAALRLRSERTGAAADLNEAIEIANTVLNITPVDDPNRMLYLFHLGLALLTQSSRTGDAAKLDTAIEADQNALDIAPANHPIRPLVLSNLGAALRLRFERTGVSADLDSAIAVGKTAVDDTPPGDRQRPMMLSNLGVAYLARFVLTGETADLDAAIETSRAAIDDAAEGDIARPKYMSNLGGALLARFAQSEKLTDLDIAIETFQSAVASTTFSDPERTARLSNLGTALRVRFERAGELGDLDAAIEISRAAVDATPAGHPDRAMMLSSLGVELQERSERTGEQADLDAAIEASRAAVKASSLSHADRGMYLSSLGNALLQRFERAGALADIDAAIGAIQAAVEAASGGHLHRAAYLSNLGIALRDRFARIGVLADLDAAIEVGRASVEASPTGHPDQALYMTNLASALYFRFGQTADTNDLDAAIDTMRTALTNTPADHPRRASALANLAAALLTQAGHTGAREDLDVAIESAQAGVRADSPGHPSRAGHLMILGNALYAKFRLSGLPADSEAALSAFAEAAGAGEATPLTRIQAAAVGAWLAAQVRPDQAADLLEVAVRLLPDAAPIQLQRSDQQYALGKLAGLASEAAAAALADVNGGTSGDERATRALRLLEAGRAVLLSQALDTRNDLTDLEQRYPDLAARFIELRDLLNQPPVEEITPVTIAPGRIRTGGGQPERVLRDRRRVASEFDAIRAQIRALDGFAAFGLPPSADELRAEAAQGPVVVFITGIFGCDALLLTDNRITAIELPSLTVAALAGQVRSFHEAVRATADPGATSADQGVAQARMCEVLAWLWDTATGPVLQALGYDRQPAAGEEWPRVWWAPGGLLGLLPIHAAGHHQDAAGGESGRPAVMDRVVSSYTPTVRALRYSRQHARTANDGAGSGSLIVAMHTTPGMPGGALPSVQAEVNRVRALLPRPIVLSEPEPGQRPGASAEYLPTRTNVLAQLPGCAIAHFACHGASDPADPSKSLLLLRDHATDPLTVASLAAVNLSHAQLAYLSACQTAAVPADGLVDEAIHLATAFQLAGFPSVVGTLWEITETAAVNIAAAFYARLRTDQDTLDTGNAAIALHHCIRSRRDKYPSRPFLWAGYLHAGV